MSETTNDIDYTQSSGNVFADMGLPDADELQFKSDLLIRIQIILDERGLSDTQAAATLSLAPALVDALRHGSLDALTLDQLFHCLNRLGLSVYVRLSDTSADDARTFLVAA